MKTYYFDYNATTPVAPQVITAMEPFWKEQFANPSSSHHQGRLAVKILRECHQKFAVLLNCSPEEIIFTSGGTEGNNAAIQAALALHPNKKTIVTSPVEHSSVRKLIRDLGKRGYRIHTLKVDEHGQLNENDLMNALNEDVVLVSLMAANNETGVLFPIEKIASILKSRNILFHVDAVQLAGKLEINLKKFNVDFLTLAAHKFYGPKGIGLLYVRHDLAFRALISGGGQEKGRRGGTENIPAIVGMTTAYELVNARYQQENNRLESLRNIFEAAVKANIPDVIINAEKSPRISNTSNITFRGIEGETLLMILDQKGICVSMGSACMSGGHDPSHVLLSMGRSENDAKASLRFSFGQSTNEEQIQFLVSQLEIEVKKLRSFQTPIENSAESTRSV